MHGIKGGLPSCEERLTISTVLIVPGLYDSGPGHWQSWFQSRLPHCRRVNQRDWANPDLPSWGDTLIQAVRRAREPVWIVAHSFGCLATAQAGAALGKRIAGAMLVAPADPAKFGVSAKLPMSVLQFETLVIASENDPWMSLDSARRWSAAWGAELVNAGAAGHINLASGHGPWSEGLRYLKRLQRTALAQAEAVL